MAKVIVNLGVAGVVIGDLTWSACQRVRDDAAVSTTGATLTPFDAVGSYWLENPNVTEDTLFLIYLTATPTTKRLGKFLSPTSIDLCNKAILGLGGNVITSLSDTSAEGVLCNALWSTALDAVLRLHPWNCAVKRAVLSPDAAAPAYEWSAAFSLPSDLLRLLDLDGVTDYKIEGRKILCDESTLNIRYIWRNETLADWDSLLVETMVAWLRAKLAYPITKSNAVREAESGSLTDVLRAAKAIDAQEEPGETFGDFPLLNVRG